MKNYIQYFYDGGKYTTEQVKKQQQFLREKYGYTGSIDGLWTLKDRSKKSGTQIAAEKAEADGWIIDDEGKFVKNEVEKVAPPITTSPKRPTTYMFDNMYPYSYGDILVNESTGETRQYDGGEIPTGFRLRQTTANDSPTLQILSGAKKIINSVSGIDPRREMMNKLADLDLSTKEGLAEWYRLIPEAKKIGVIRTGGDPINAQWEMRARLDNMSMYNNGTQLYNTYIINDEYESPTAKSHNQKTYRIADAKQRERINAEMANYFLKHRNEGHWNADHTAYILEHMGYLGNQALVADDEYGTNLRNGDWWDYTINSPLAILARNSSAVRK